MPALFLFLFKVNAALLLFCAGYYLVLRRLTFYSLNRAYLMIAVIFSTAYPLININSFASRHEQFTGSVRQVIINWKAPANALVKPLMERPDYWRYAEWTFWAGVILLLVRFAVQLIALYRLHHKSALKNILGYKVRVTNSDTGPFSFWQNIYLNPDNHSEHDLKAILRHEQIHVDDLHMIDILVAECSTIFYWFNPGVWLMKRAVKENIEFITDRKILAGGTDSKSYQYSLLSVSVATSSNRIVNNFNLSTIKKRIIMMNAKRSSKRKLARYAFLLPGVVVLLLVLSLSNQAIAKKTFNHINSILLNTTGVSMVTPSSLKPAVLKPVNKHDTVEQWAQKRLSDTIIYKKSANKNRVFMITAAHKPDSLTYLIDAKQVTKADFDAMPAEKIAGISYVTAEDVTKYLPGIDSKRDVVMVATEGSKEGEDLFNKLHNSKSIAFNPASKNRVNVSTGRTYQHYSYSISGDSGPGNAVTQGYSSGSGNGSIGVSNVTDNSASSGRDSAVNTVFVTGKPAKLYSHATVVYTTTTDTNLKSITLKAKPAVWHKSPRLTVVKGKNIKLATLNNNTLQIVPDSSYTTTNLKLAPVNRVYIGRTDKETVNLNSLENKLIIIDGKESSLKQLKKIAATDINSMSVLSDGAATNAYGDKGKNGVLVITTRKKS